MIGRVQHWKSVEDWKSVGLEECKIGIVYDWKKESMTRKGWKILRARVNV